MKGLDSIWEGKKRIADVTVKCVCVWGGMVGGDKEGSHLWLHKERVNKPYHKFVTLSIEEQTLLL